MIHFDKPNISPTVFEMILRYLYTGILDFENQTGSDIFDLLVASDELLIEETVIFVQKYLIENRIEWYHTNFNKVLQTVFQFESCKQFQEYCLDSICEVPEPFFNSQNFPKLEKSILLGLFKREDLQIEEVELWNHLVKWGIAQTSELNGKRMTDLESWNETDFLALKNTLDQFISHIRFFEMSSIDFHNNVWPFREVLPKKLFESIISFHMSNTQPRQIKFPRHRKIAINSTIIKSKHATILTNWIQRKDAITKIPEGINYFRLIYRGSKDGYDFDIISNKCIFQGAYILLIKVKENGSIIGGYNPLGWNVNQIRQYNGHNWGTTSDSFIFSLGDGTYFKDFKLCRVTDSSRAICNNALNFGNSDLVVNVNRGTCKQQFYQGSILDINAFTIEEMEIFAYMSPLKQITNMAGFVFCLLVLLLYLFVF